ncbi:hypothetical protein BVRB_1g022720 [Beta vulgaris subsp. vulgaris]|uniref:Uncharacterized protein n=1 Tax=Beta vulgaris subsp. vulgaris TaxID=3555 RepID=A0A0J8BHQ8_BETVV|nr:hypothetical protein BVRB_1g022720 [Beta vulgaris subsp. vulgaris]
MLDSLLLISGTTSIFRYCYYGASVTIVRFYGEDFKFGGSSLLLQGIALAASFLWCFIDYVIDNGF